MLSGSEGDDDRLAAMEAGSFGYVLKGIASRDLVAIFRRVLDGEGYANPSLAGHLPREMGKRPPARLSDALTSRGREGLQLVAAGRSNAEIGRELNLTEKTVKH